MDSQNVRLASVEKIKAIVPHPNADNLEFAKVLEYNCIVLKGRYKVGDFIVLIQPDTVLPTDEWADFYRKRSKRVKATKIRGYWSFGIVESLDILPIKECSWKLVEGEEVGEMLGITKYEAPEPQELNARRALPFGIPKTDQPRYQNLNIEELLGQEVIVTQKIDGQSFTVYYNEGEMGVCGRTLEYKLDSENNYTKNFHRLNFELFAMYCKHHKKNLALRGEQFGAGIQRKENNPHSGLPLGLKFYSVWDIDNKRYISPFEQHNVFQICKSMNGFQNSHVPIVYEGPLTRDLMHEYESISELNGKPFEGVVVEGHNFSFKVINFNYDDKN